MEKTLSIASGTLSDEEFYQLQFCSSQNRTDHILCIYRHYAHAVCCTARKMVVWWIGLRRSQLARCRRCCALVYWLCNRIGSPGATDIFPTVATTDFLPHNNRHIDCLVGFVQRFLWRSNWMERF